MDRMYDGRVPHIWEEVSYPSLKPLSSWISDLLKRLRMFRDWLDFGPPGVFWISGFFFTQGFLTGTLQNYARAHRIPIDEIAFDFHVLPDVSPSNPTVTGPEEGVYIHGLYLEGARWDSTAADGGVLAEPIRRQLFSEMPVIWLRPVHAAKLAAATAAKAKQAGAASMSYTCPVYKTSKRAGTLSTTGHSTNFILAIRLASNLPERHWVKRGVALLCQLDT